MFVSSFLIKIIAVISTLNGSSERLVMLVFVQHK